MKHKRDMSYIKIWKKTYGDIPKDDQGRSYEIHHIDGNAENNLLENLACVSIEEHYKIHLSQGDYFAARYIAMRMGIDPQITRSLIIKAQQERVKNGTHNFLAENGGSERSSRQQQKKVEEGIHCFITKEFEEKRLVGYRSSIERRKTQGSYHLITDNPTNKRMKEGTHNFIGPSQNTKMLAEGKHPSQMKKECPYCGVIMDVANYARYHGDKCKRKEVK